MKVDKTCSDPSMPPPFRFVQNNSILLNTLVAMVTEWKYLNTLLVINRNALGLDIWPRPGVPQFHIEILNKPFNFFSS